MSGYWRKIATNKFCFCRYVCIFERHIDQHGKCKFVLASESGKFNEEGTGGHFPASYHSWYGRGTAAYFIFEVFQNLLAEWASVPRFLHIEYTISFFGTGEEALKHSYYENFKFP